MRPREVRFERGSGAAFFYLASVLGAASAPGRARAGEAEVAIELSRGG